MDLTYVPLLHVQRDLYRLPRGMERFRQYLRTMLNGAAYDMQAFRQEIGGVAASSVPR